MERMEKELMLLQEKMPEVKVTKASSTKCISICTPTKAQEVTCAKITQEAQAEKEKEVMQPVQKKVVPQPKEKSVVATTHTQSKTMKKKVDLTTTEEKKSMYRNRRYQFQGHNYYCAVWGHMARNCRWRYPNQAPRNQGFRGSLNQERRFSAPARKFYLFC